MVDMRMTGTADEQGFTRFLDRQFAGWVVKHFAAGLSAADRNTLQRLAEAVSYAIHLKHTCLDLGCYTVLQESTLDNVLHGISAVDVCRVLGVAPSPLLRSNDGQRVWLRKYHAFEYSVATQLRVLQQQARLEIITGGPGTGKTWTAAQRIRTVLEQDPHCAIALAAPTGKAANTMMNALAKSGFAAEQHNLKGLTLHSLLGMTGRSPEPKRHSRNPLACDLLIVDEASMIDLPMMYRLLQALPAHARLLLLGDKDQLASVEAGSVMGDICSAFAATGCVTALQESRRYKDSPEIGQLAEALNAGTVPAMHDNTAVKEHTLDAAQPWQPGWLDTALTAYRQLPCLGHDTPVAAVLQAQQQFQILCALREGPQGVAGVNMLMERALGKKAGSWYAGKPVMITRNDHERKLYNGDVGLVLPLSADGMRVDPQGDLKACFLVNGGLKTVSLAQMPPHDTCYAITIHKSQGSEYEHVLIVLPADLQAAREHPVLTRELVYTAVTRAKSRIDLWCGAGVLATAASKTTQRMSGLGQALTADCP